MLVPRATNSDQIEEGGDAERIAALKAKVAALERQLKVAHSGGGGGGGGGRRHSTSGSGSGSGSGSAAPADAPPPPSFSSSSNPPRHPAAAALRKDATTVPSAHDESTIWRTVRDIWALRLGLHEPDETETVLRYLAAQSAGSYAGGLDLGRGNVHWRRLGEPLMAKVLTIHLLDGESTPTFFFRFALLRLFRFADEWGSMTAAVRACCSRLPGIYPLAQKIGEYKHKLDSLTPAEEVRQRFPQGRNHAGLTGATERALQPRLQCSVAVLAALGARASPHSQLLGIDTVCLADGTPSPPLFLYAGERREMACRQLESRARELCWSHGFFEHAKIEHLDSTVGLVQLLICESCFFLGGKTGGG